MAKSITLTSDDPTIWRVPTRKGTKYRYLIDDDKHPYEWKACETCGIESWIQTRRRHCSYACSKRGDKNPSRQKATDHGLTKVQYSAVHTAVRKARGSAHGCVHCGTEEDRMYHWANVTGNYWDIEDYISLCVPCHDRFDRSKHQ